jgi:hypothetical protein
LVFIVLQICYIYIIFVNLRYLHEVIHACHFAPLESNLGVLCLGAFNALLLAGVKKQFQKCIPPATLVCVSALLAINPAINSKCLEEGGNLCANFAFGSATSKINPIINPSETTRTPPPAQPFRPLRAPKSKRRRCCCVRQ